LIVMILMVVAALVLLALWLRYGAKRPQVRAARVPDRKRPTDNFRCVEIRYRNDACEAVKQIGPKRFLSGEAPEIPVPGCDAAKCVCRYVHHADRRHMDRRSPIAYQPPASAGGERRIKRDRRRPAKTPLNRR